MIEPSRLERLRITLREPDGYAIALVLIMLTVLLTATLGDARWGQLLAACLAGLTLLFILSTSRAPRRVVRVSAVVVVLAILGATLAVALGTDTNRAPYLLAVAIMAVVAPVFIVRRLATHTVVTLRTVAGALCLYVLIGLFYAMLYAVANDLSGDFFAQTADPILSDFVYYSYITLTTVGYGDFTPAAPAGRMLAVSEALIGQLYLVSAVALLIGNLGRPRPRRASVEVLDELEGRPDEGTPESMSGRPA